MNEDAGEWVLMLAERTHEDAPEVVRSALGTLACHLPCLASDAGRIRAGRLGAEHAVRCPAIEWVPGQDALGVAAA